MQEEGRYKIFFLLPLFSDLRPECEIMTEWWMLYDPVLAEKKQELGISRGPKEERKRNKLTPVPSA